MTHKKTKLALAAIIIILVLTFSPLIYEAITTLYFADYRIRKEFDSVQIGATKEMVIAKLGAPDKQDTTFHLGQYQGFEKEYAEAEESGSEYYLFWYGEIDVVYVMGFNGKDKIVIKSSGGT